MALEGWDWFIKLAENENFTKAADELQISQQTLSARLVSLERNLGAKLVVRGTPISLTSAGKVFLLYAREQRQAQQDMIRQIGEVAGGGAGVLKVGISHTRGSYLMPKVIHRLSDELPAVTVKLIEDTNRNLLRSAERGEVDVAIARFEGTCPGVEVEPIYKEEIVLAARADVLSKAMGTSPESAIEILKGEGISALKKCPFILGSVDDISGRVAYTELRNAGIKPHVVATVAICPPCFPYALKGWERYSAQLICLIILLWRAPICYASPFLPSRATPSSWAFPRVPNVGRWSIPSVVFCWRLRRKSNFAPAK